MSLRIAIVLLFVLMVTFVARSVPSEHVLPWGAYINTQIHITHLHVSPRHKIHTDTLNPIVQIASVDFLAIFTDVC